MLKLNMLQKVTRVAFLKVVHIDHYFPNTLMVQQQTKEVYRTPLLKRQQL